MEVLPFVAACAWSLKELKRWPQNRISFKEKIHLITCLLRYFQFILTLHEQARQFVIDDLKRTEDSVSALVAGCKELNTVS